MTVPRYRVRLLGGSSIEAEDGGSAGLPLHRHPFALAAFLAVEADRTVPRDRLVAILWPDFDAGRARNRLRVTLHALRDALGRDVFVSVSDGLRLDATRLRCDLLDFTAALEAGDPARAVTAYGGPFLEGFHLPDSVEFDQWADAHRDQLARMHRDALEQLAERSAAAGDMAAAAEWWGRRVQEEPFSGHAVVRLMDALERVGDPAAALRAEESYARLLREEFDTKPAPEIAALAQRIRDAPGSAVNIPTGDDPGMRASPPAAGRSGVAESGIGTPSPTLGKLPDAVRRVGRRQTAFGLLLSGVVGYSTLRVAGVIGDHRLTVGGEPITRHTLVLADFRGFAEDSLLARVVTEALRIDAMQSDVVNLEDRARVREVLTAMRRPIDLPLDEETAREVASRLGSRAIVDGEIGRAGPGYVLTARVITADSARELAGFRANARDSTDLLDAIERLSRDVRKRAGEPLRSVRASAPLGLVTTSSLPALRIWAEARDLEAAGSDRPRAIRLLEEATALDPEFAMAWWLLAAVHANDNRRAAWLTATERAIATADRLPAEERHQVRWQYALATGDFTTAEEELRELKPLPWNNLSGVAWYRGDFEKAEEYAMRAIDVAESAGRVPRWVVYWNLAVPQMDLGRIAEARATAEASGASNGNPGVPGLHWLIDFMEGRYDDAAARQAIDDVFRRGQPDLIRGRIAAARVGLERSVSRGDMPASMAEIAISLAGYLLLGQNQSLDRIEQFVRDPIPERFNEQLLAEPGVVLAMDGRIEAAGSARAAYEQRVPRRARWQDVHLLEAIDAFTALTQGRASDALAALRRARSATPWTAPVDALLGHAYDRLGVTDSAGAAYTRYIETPWAYRGGPYSWISDPWLLVPIHERLAQLLDASGKHEASARHARRVVEIWGNADPELQPRVRAAARLLQVESG